MGISTETLIMFIVYLIGMLVIGIMAYRLTDDLSDYVLGGRRLGAAVAALSAGASDMSGWLLLGLPGAVYALGLNQIWIVVGLSVGAYMNWKFVAKRLRSYTEVANDSITVPDFLENRFHDQSRILRLISAFVILLFFTFYTASGFVAGAKLFEKSFGMDASYAIWISAIVVIAYTFLGGFLAVSWTDFVQGMLMLLALVTVPIVSFKELGGINETIDKVRSMDPAFLNVFHHMDTLAIVSLLAWGLGYFGQPHIITRFMAIQSAKQIPKARRIGMSWMIFCLLGAVLIGFSGIPYFAEHPLKDPEIVFIMFTHILFNPWIAGILLAAILAAIMSTISSQLLVSSSAVAEDFYKAVLRKNASPKELVLVGRLAVLVISGIAMLLAYTSQDTVLSLVSYAWAGFGAAFGPMILFSLFWKRMTRNGALAGMVTGAVTVVVWKWLSTPPTGGVQADAIIPFALYEIVPGFVFASIAIIVFSLLGPKPTSVMEEEFEAAKVHES